MTSAGLRSGAYPLRVLLALALVGCGGGAASPVAERCVASYQSATSTTPTITEYIGASPADCADYTNGMTRIPEPPAGEPACTWQEPSGVVVVVYGQADAEAYCASVGQ